MNVKIEDRKEEGCRQNIFNKIIINIMTYSPGRLSNKKNMFRKLIFTILISFLSISPVMAQPTNLYEYFSEKGEKLPSIQERAVYYDIIDSISVYRGTASQNESLLSYYLYQDWANEQMEQNIVENPEFGDFFGGVSGSSDLPKITANFESSLISRISKTDTSMDLVDSTDEDGTTLSGWYGFTVDSNSSKREYIIGNCTGSNCTSLLRGVSYSDGVSTSSDRAFVHGRGADVSITDHPNLTIITNILNGTDGIPSKIYYDSSLSINPSDSSKTLVDLGYVNSLIANGVATTTQTVFGGGKEATQSQLSSGYYDINDPRLVTTRYATSSSDVATTSLVVTQSDGTIKNNFIDQDANYSFSGNNSHSGENTFTGTTTFTQNLMVNGQFGLGGDGSDGALNITSGTTTIDVGAVNVFEKNYTSINISAGAGLTFSNPGSGGTIVILKSQGDVVIDGYIDVRTVGGAGGAGGTGNGGNGSNGTAGFAIQDTTSHVGVGGNGTQAGGGIYSNLFLYSKYYGSLFNKNIVLAVGSGGGGGEAGSNGSGCDNNGGAGGRGGGSIYIEVGGEFDFSGIINVSGNNGSNASVCAPNSGSGGGGGGGGASGMAIVAYRFLSSNTGTILSTGGTGGDGESNTSGSSVGGNGGSGAGCYGGAGGGGASPSGLNGGGGGGGGGIGGAGTVGTSPITGGAGGATGSSVFYRIY